MKPQVLSKQKKAELKRLAWAEMRRLMGCMPEIESVSLHKQKPRISVSELTTPEQILFAQEVEMPLYKGGIPMIEKKLPRAARNNFKTKYEGETRQPTNIFQWITKEGGIEESIEFREILDAYKEKPAFVRQGGKSLDELTDAMQEQFWYLYANLNKEDHQERLTRTVTILTEALTDKTYSQKLMDQGELNKWIAESCDKSMEEEDAKLYEGLDEFCVRNGYPTPKEIEEAYWAERR